MSESAANPKIKRMQTMVEELENISEKQGYCVTPYEMNEMINMASKIFAMFTKPCGLSFTYRRMLFTLELVESIIRDYSGIGGKDNAH